MARTPTPAGPARTVRRAAAKASPGHARPAAGLDAPKLSKEELRIRVEKLEGTVSALRAKNRELVRQSKEATARVAELEHEVDALQRHASKAGRRGREIDPGDAVPPGVAPLEPAPMDSEAKRARRNLERHLVKE